MSNIVENIRTFMRDKNIFYLLVNSTNKYLEEYTPINENSRYYLTGFSGSTGDVLVTLGNIYLFVDGRYHIQADLEVNHDIISVVKLKTGQSFLDELIKKIPEGEVLGIYAKKNSQARDYTKRGINLIFISDQIIRQMIQYVFFQVRECI